MTKLIFPSEGQNRKAGFGLVYVSDCQQYELYESTQVDGVPVSPPRWLAVRRQPVPVVIGRFGGKTGRRRAIKACRADLARPPKPRRRRVPVKRGFTLPKGRQL